MINVITNNMLTKIYKLQKKMKSSYEITKNINLYEVVSNIL